MIALINSTPRTVKIQYTSNSKVFKKEILPNSITAMKSLNNVSQVKNKGSLVSQGIGIYNYDNGAFINNVKSNFNFGYDGVLVATGMTFTMRHMPFTTGWTFVTSANTLMANGTVTATTVGSSTRVGFSGDISTAAWLGKIKATAFSGFGISIIGTGTTTYVQSAGTTTLTLTASTYSASIDKFVFVGNNVKPGGYEILSTNNFATGLAFLSGRT